MPVPVVLGCDEVVGPVLAYDRGGRCPPDLLALLVRALLEGWPRRVQATPPVAPSAVGDGLAEARIPR